MEIDKLFKFHVQILKQLFIVKNLIFGVRTLRPRTLRPKRTLRPNVNYAQVNYDNVISYATNTPSALNAGAKRSGATCHMAMPQCCYLAKEAKRPSHTTNI